MLLISWINLLAPFGYMAMYVFLLLDPLDTIMPYVDDAMALMESVTSLMELLAISDGDYNGDETV